MCDMMSNGNAPTCSCSEDCIKYSACCLDHEFREEELHVTKELVRLNECRRPYMGRNDAYILRSRCSSNWSAASDSGFLIKESCEEEDRLTVKERLSNIVANNSNYDTDLLSEVWVTSMRTSLTYKNIFCLVCNFDFDDETTDDEIIFWPNIVKCQQKYTESPAESEAKCSVDHKVNVVHPSDSRFELFRQSLLPCYTKEDSVIDDCPKSYSYDPDQIMTRLKCQTIFSPVREMDGKNSIYYRNQWCAKCHGVQSDRILCLDGHLPRRSGPTTDTPAFEHSFDNFTVSLERSASGRRKERRCRSTEMFDPFINACRQFLCNKHEDCRLVVTSSAFGLTTTHLLLILTTALRFIL